MNTTSVEDRFAKALAIVPKHGSHGAPPKDAVPEKACLMELYAWVAGEEWSYAPQCVSPAIARLVVRFNDRCGSGELADSRRANFLRELCLVPLNTRRTPAVEKFRVWMATDWAVRVATPRLLRLAGLSAQADRLEAMPAITSEATLADARVVLFAVRDDAWTLREEARQRLRAKYAADAAAAAAAAADAAAAAAAVAVADADADAPEFRRIFDAAKQASLNGGGWYDCYGAARAVADEVFKGRPSRFATLRDDLDADLVVLVKRMAAVAA